MISLQRPLLWQQIYLSFLHCMSCVNESIFMLVQLETAGHFKKLSDVPIFCASSENVVEMLY